MKPIVILTCEHATNFIPLAFQQYFDSHVDMLASHLGVDIGAFEIAKGMHQALDCDLYHTKVSRLLIDCNRSLNRPHCFSAISKTFDNAKKAAIIEDFYRPYRQKVEQKIASYLQDQRIVWHFSIHSFTPILNGITRQTDIGLLYDPKQAIEKKIVQALQLSLKSHSDYRIRKNYPYLGISNGFTTFLRKKFPINYAGIEIEVNQKWLSNNASNISEITHLLTKVLSLLSADNAVF